MRTGMRLDLVQRGGSTYTRRARPNALELGLHGSLRCYRAGCRCADCVHAQREYHRLRHATRQALRGGCVNRRVPIRRSALALEELCRRGWTISKISVELGCHPSTVQRIVRQHRRRERARCWSIFERRLLELCELVS